MNITLESVQAEQARLAGLIDRLLANSKTTSVALPACNITLAPGEHYAGLIIDKDGTPSYHLILLPGDAQDHTWEEAKEWAAEQAGELPSRREQSLLFANLKEHFEHSYYWSSEQHESNSGCAWYQYFYYGTQDLYDQSSSLRARAVRRLILD